MRAFQPAVGRPGGNRARRKGRSLLLCVSILPLLAMCSCWCLHPSQTFDKDAAKEEISASLESLKTAVDMRRDPDFARAYSLLSKESRKRYSYGEFMNLLSLTKAGYMLRFMITDWNIARIDYTDGGARAEVVYSHFAWPEYRNHLFFIREADKDGKGRWRVDFYFADVLGMPRNDEDNLLTKPAGKPLPAATEGGGGSSPK
jgi:hypothetical protein